MPTQPRRPTMPALLAVGAVAVSALLAGCSGSAAADTANPDVLKMGVPPGEADPELLDRMQPVADLVAEATGKEVEVTKTSDYLAIVEAMRSGLLDVAMFSPMPTVLAQDVADVQPLVAALGAPYTTQVICRPDAGVDALADIQDRTIAFVDPGSTSGNYVPRLMLQRAGVDLEALDSTYAGGHDVAALSVKQGSTDCAAVASLLLPGLVESGTLAETDFEVVAESEPLPISMVIIAREGLDPNVTEQITDAFVDSQSPEVLEVTQATELVRSADADWTLFRDAADELGVSIEDVE
jgi:phosphonate transport system substrate-binding protein